MYLGNNYLRAFHGEWGSAWPRLHAAASILGVHYASEGTAVTQGKADWSSPWHVLSCFYSLFSCARTHCCY